MYQPKHRVLSSNIDLPGRSGTGDIHDSLLCVDMDALDRPDRSTGLKTLVVDDDDLVRETFAAVLNDEGYCTETAASGKEALACLSDSKFDLVLSDVFMPDMNGLELLNRIRQDYDDLPVIMITGYGNTSMAREALEHGACDFVTKPCGPGELPIVVERNLLRKAMQSKTTELYQQALLSSHETVLDALLTALDTRDTETHGHSERVTAYTIQLAERLRLSSDEMYHVERGALLHDIGKIGVPDRILLKPGKLTPEEWVEMRKHPIIGYAMCSRIESLRQAAQIVLHHHEAWNGSGYPYHLHGTDIPLGARLFAVADTLDAITSDRPYRAALPFAAARAEIVSHAGKQFDPTVVETFLKVPESRWVELKKRATP